MCVSDEFSEYVVRSCARVCVCVCVRVCARLCEEKADSCGFTSSSRREQLRSDRSSSIFFFIRVGIDREGELQGSLRHSNFDDEVLGISSFSFLVSPLLTRKRELKGELKQLKQLKQMIRSLVSSHSRLPRDYVRRALKRATSDIAEHRRRRRSPKGSLTNTNSFRLCTLRIER